MGDVAAVNFRIIVRAAARRGFSREDVLRDAPSRNQLVRDDKRMYSWQDYVAVMERFADLLGGYEQLSAVGETVADDVPEGALLDSFVSPAALYYFLYRVVNPATFRVMQHACRRERDGRLRVSHVLDRDCAPCVAFGWGTVGALRALPRYIGLEAAKVDVLELTDRGVSCLVTLPRSRTLLACARQAFPAFAKSVLPTLEGKSEVLMARSALQAIGTQMDVQSEALAAEMVLRRQAESALGCVLDSLANAAFIVTPEEMVGANALGRSALQAEGQQLELEIRSATRNPSRAVGFNVASIEGNRSFVVVRCGTAADIARRLQLAQSQWQLTGRQTEVLRGLVNGQSNRELADSLHCTMRTVESHMTALMERSDAISRLSLVSSFWSDL
jgi:DNA-binding CsgD family transcriptional regulator